MENIAVRQVGPNNAKKAIARAFKKKRPFFIWGPPGIGKSRHYPNKLKTKWKNVI